MYFRLKAFNQRIKKMHYAVRWVLGICLIIGGILWILPILGIWMIPLGLLVLAPDFRWARRGYLSIMVFVRKFRDKRRSKRQANL